MKLKSKVGGPFGHDIIKAKRTLIDDIKYWKVDTCRFKLAPTPTGLTGPSPIAVEDELLPPMLELALSSQYSIQYKIRFEKHKYL